MGIKLEVILMNAMATFDKTGIDKAGSKSVK